MSDRASEVISEEDKQHLVKHLLDEVTKGISGRDGADLVDLAPARSIFAGVLQPRWDHTQSAQLASAPAGTAIGIDFRVVPSAVTRPIRLRIRARWSVYYPVFPSWEQVVRSSEGQLATGPEGAQSDDSTDETSAEFGNESQSAATTTTGEELPAAEDNGTIVPSDHASTSGRVILPRVFRRHDVRLDDVEIVVAPGEAEIAREDINREIAQAKAAMRADARMWRHLADPAKNERDLGDSLTITNRASYEAALRAVRGAPVTLPSWDLTLAVDSSADAGRPDATRIRVLLSNVTPAREDQPTSKDPGKADLIEPDVGLQERAIFDTQMWVQVEEGAILPFDFLLAPSDYRTKPQMPAKGINCVAVVDDASSSLLRTEALPLFKQPLYRTRADLEARFDTLASDTFASELRRIEFEMEAYLRKWDEYLEHSASSTLTKSGREACALDREQFSMELQRYRLGISALERDRRLADAFRLMNEAFARLGNASNDGIHAWRLFQIGFIVSQLPSLAARETPRRGGGDFAEAVHAAHDEVGILWFPTGGGKTEAYLGLISVALLYDRLRGKTRGVTAWMRFPLRMLSLQQLERLARVIAALEVLRSQTAQLAIGDPFAIGYFVGDSVTPNSISEDEMKRLERDKNYREEKRLLRRCPFCRGAVEIVPRRKDWRLAHVCTNAECFSHTSESLGPYKASLPVCIVDNEIYRYLPSVLVGTVDKLAIIGRSRHFAHFIKGVSQRCPEHGYTSYDECIERWIGCRKKKRELHRLPPARDPGVTILIQDELHLLRAELGVFNGHYEGLLRYLGARVHMPPKVLAATATIEAYDTHAFHVYLSRARRFPQPSWQQGESFYATSTPLVERRHYLGVRCHTRAVEDLVLHLLAHYQRAVRRLLTNPRRAALIMGREDLSDAAVQDTLRLYDLSLVYVNRKAAGGSVQDKLSRVERFLAPESLGEITSRLLTGDQTIEEIGDAIDRIALERKDTGEPRLDVVIATNLISHGVDLERINMMAVAGVPSHYAEYVQASSRAARSHPGIIFVCFMGRDPRETSQYEFFPAMHQHMDRLIEAVAVNRFASFAPRKTVPGLLAGVLLCDQSPDLYATGKIGKPLDHVPTLKIALGQAAGSTGMVGGVVSEDSLRSAIEQIIGVDVVHPPASPAQVANVKARVAEVTEDLFDQIGRGLDQQLKDILKPITSFRDVDEGIDFGSVDSSNLVTRLRAK
jgi:hypothetical protein